MNRKLKRWEISLMCGLAIAILAGGWLKGEQEALSSSVIRLHVIANSDDEEDQRLKLAVRDEVLRCAEKIYPVGADRRQAEAVLNENLPLLAEAGQRVSDRWGTGDKVTAALEQCWFPTKEYDGFVLPAGSYRALRVVIGEGKGQNWWCVAFPPLCMGAASETVEEAVLTGSFPARQAALVTGTDKRYVLKLKSLELLGELQHFLAN